MISTLAEHITDLKKRIERLIQKSQIEDCDIILKENLKELAFLFPLYVKNIEKTIMELMYDIV